MREDKHRKLIKNIETCGEVCKKPREQMLLGHGCLSANVMFVGIGPNISYNGTAGRSVFGGYGRSGSKVQRILKIITAKTKKQRGSKKVSFWLTNIIKCGCSKTEVNRVMKRCNVFLSKEIDLIRPKVVVLFGAKVIKQMLKEKMVHGKIVYVNGKCYIHSYHPSPLSKLEETEIKSLTGIIAREL